jgi:polyphosphate kinase
VQIDLLIRGVCALRPGVAGLSENIRVRSVVGRFLEHTRLFYFGNEGAEDVFLSSADWMDRNFFRRIELAFPVLDPALKQRVVREGLQALPRRRESGLDHGLRRRLRGARTAARQEPCSGKEELLRPGNQRPDVVAARALHSRPP